MRNFPHLSDTKFPDLGTVDVYQFQNTFDYRRWSEDTRVRCVNVLWNSDYGDVVKFDTDSERDSWFDSLTDFYAIELSQAARIVPDNFVKLPIPYDVMARYNYLYIDMPVATSSDAPLDYETEDGIRRWYFFVDSISYLSPNSTQVFLTLDVWTNFQNAVEINYMMLERGHAPVAVTDVDTYLENPVGRNAYLLAPDVNFDNAGITRSSDYIPFGNGRKYVCMASTCAPEQIATLGTVTSDPSYDPFSGNITYSDVDARYGHQLQVNGLTLGNGRNYGNARTPAKAGASDDGFIANNLSVYAIPAEECYGSGTFFADVVAQCPQFLNTVRACFVVDESCLTLGTAHMVAGHALYRCVGSRRKLLTKRLQVSDFGYPEEYQRFAKLYTSPYARLEVTDNDGTTFEINIEETSTVQVRSVVSVAFPYIDYRVYLDGIGGVGSKSYSWVDLRGQSSDLEISQSDWFKYCFDWEIPTFALYMDGETAYQLGTFNRATKQGVSDALVAYHNSMRSANTAKENAEDSADTALANVQNSTATARQNAYNSADTGKTNADNSADTAKANTDASADTMYTNVDNNCTTLRTNLNATIANTIANEEAGIAASDDITAYGNARADDKTAIGNSVINSTTRIESEVTTATTFNNGNMTIFNSMASGAQGGANLGATFGGAGGAALGTLEGMLMGGISGEINAMNADGNAVEIVNGNAHVAGVTIDANEGYTYHSKLMSTHTQQQSDAQRRTVYRNNNNLADTEMTNNNANDRTNANNTRTTEKANATRSQTTAKTNATNTQSTSKTNADNNFNTDRTNASNTRNTTVANAGYTRQVSELNAKELLENAANSSMAGTLDARNASPVAIGESSGNSAPDYMRTRGIQMKVKTQSDSAIRQTGDTFARYGYALNQVWDVREGGLCLMRNFTYWKASDIWVDDRQSSNNLVQDFFTNIFLSGVTVWSDPTRIGRVSIYDN